MKEVKAIDRESFLQPEQRYVRISQQMGKAVIRTMNRLRKGSVKDLGRYTRDIAWLYKIKNTYPDYNAAGCVDFHANTIDVGGIKIMRNNLGRLKEFSLPYNESETYTHNSHSFFTHEGIEEVLSNSAFASISFQKRGHTYTYKPRLLHMDDIHHMLFHMPGNSEAKKITHLLELLHLTPHGCINKDGKYVCKDMGCYLLERDNMQRKYILSWLTAGGGKEKDTSNHLLTGSFGEDKVAAPARLILDVAA